MRIHVNAKIHALFTSRRRAGASIDSDDTDSIRDPWATFLTEFSRTVVLAAVDLGIIESV